MAQPDCRDRMGRLCQTDLRRTSTSAEIPGALYPPRRDLPPTADFAGKRPRDFPLEELRSWQPTRHHDPAGGGVHAPLSARFAPRLRQSPALRIADQPQPAKTLALCRKLLAASSPARDFHPAHDRLANQAETDQRDRCPRCQPGACSTSKLCCRNRFRPPCSTSLSAAMSAKWTRRSKDAPASNTFSFRSRRRFECPGLCQARQLAHPPAFRGALHPRNHVDREAFAPI